MRKKLTRIGNSWGLVLPKEVLELLGLAPGGEVELQVVGNTLIVTGPEVDPEEIEAALAYLRSRNERERLYKKLADA